MTAEFDPYHKWLGITPAEHPPTHYRLLGIAPFETDTDVISHAADQRMAHVRAFQSGPLANLSQRLLNEIAQARVTLLNPEQKSRYDASLQGQSSETFSPLNFGESVSQGPKVKLSRRRPRQQANPAIELIKIVAGGAFGLFMAVLLLSYFAGIDLLGWRKEEPPQPNVVAVSSQYEKTTTTQSGDATRNNALKQNAKVIHGSQKPPRSENTASGSAPTVTPSIEQPQTASSKPSSEVAMKSPPAIALSTEFESKVDERSLPKPLGASVEKELKLLMAEMPPPKATESPVFELGELRGGVTPGKHFEIQMGDFEWQDYDVHVECRHIGGESFLCLRTNPDGSERWVVAIGSWGPKNVDIRAYVAGQDWWKIPSRRWKPDLVSGRTDEWHSIDASLRGTQVSIRVDGREVALSENAAILNGRIGISFTNAHWRNLEVRDPNGRWLWKGWPAVAASPAGQDFVRSELATAKGDGEGTEDNAGAQLLAGPKAREGLVTKDADTETPERSEPEISALPDHDDAAPPAEQDAIGTKLAAATAEHERSVGKAREGVLADLKAKANSAQKAGDLGTLERVEGEIIAFQDRSELPKSVPVRTFESQIARANAKLEDAYATAIKEYTQSGQRAQAHTAQAELLEIRKQPFGRRRGSRLGQELLRNPGGEEPMVLGIIPGWMPVAGAWTSVLVPNADEGAAHFRASPVTVAELAQDVSLAPFAKLVRDGKLEVEFKGSVRSHPKRIPDLNQIIVEFRDATNRRVLDRWDSGRLASPNKWRVLSETRVVNPEVLWVRVRLQGIRSSGSNNEAYFDNLSLKATVKK